jgi:hypothetical protein
MNKLCTQQWKKKRVVLMNQKATAFYVSNTGMHPLGVKDQ